MAKKRMPSESINLQTPEFRLSFPALFEPKPVAPGSSKLKYQATMLFQVAETPESKAEGRKVVSIEPLKELIRKVLTEYYGPDRAKWPPLTQVVGGETGKISLPFRAGDELAKKNADGSFKSGFGTGIIFVKVASQFKPGLVHPYADPTTGKPALLTIPTDIKGGDYARATINAYHWEYMGKIGVSFSLQNLQKLRDGEAFGGGRSGEDDFDSIEVPAGVPAGATASPATAAATAQVAQAPAGALGI